MVSALLSVTDQQIKLNSLERFVSRILAHKLPDEVEAAYLREAYLEKRTGLMNDWAEFCTMEN